MKTIMFAGADAMTDLKETQKAVEIPQVAALLHSYGLLENLEKSITQMTRNPFPTLMASVLTQVGLYRLFVERNAGAHLLIGCSLGDLAKLVCADVASLDHVAEGLEIFCKSLKDVPAGSILQVRTTQLRGPDFFRSLEDFGIYMAIDQTPHHCLISGANEKLMAWQSQSEIAKNALVRPLFPFPLHSPLMEVPFQSLAGVLEPSRLRFPQRTLVSAVDTTLIGHPQGIIADLRKNILGQVHWQETYKWLVHQVKIKEFVNIGPIATLKYFGERTPTQNSVIIKDVLETVQNPLDITCLA